MVHFYFFFRSVGESEAPFAREVLDGSNVSQVVVLGRASGIGSIGIGGRHICAD